MKDLILKTGLLLLGFAASNSSIAATALEGTYNIDPAHTSVGFEVSHLGIAIVVGRFNTVKGEFTFVPNGNSAVNTEIKTSSVDTNVPDRDKHLRSSDFFDANRFPSMSFKSSSVEYSADGKPIKIIGTLNLHGISREIILETKAIGFGEGPAGNYRAGFQAKAKINRSDFGMKNLLAVAGDEVLITLNVEGIKK